MTPISMPRNARRSSRFCVDPRPMTGRMRRVAPSSRMAARSCAIWIEVRSLPPVMISTSPRFSRSTRDSARAKPEIPQASTRAALRTRHAGAKLAVRDVFSMMSDPHLIVETRQPPVPRSFRIERHQFAQPGARFGIAGQRRRAIPLRRLGGIAGDAADADLAQEERIVGLAEPERRLRIAGRRRALEEMPSGDDIAGGEELLASADKHGDCAVRDSRSGRRL